ncbi:hypothetical protein TorRG33x02_194640 [Trema orientale]|uniref:Zinc finger, CCHC-type n=1 Tax=Trema orientale TaxID=63057 RepID=A0A2P5EGU6_TREOI|nr:hypothetical protein TorRG33x02_194640 [Trema orientale]
MNGPELWKKTSWKPVQAPLEKNPPGGPKKLRRKEPDEIQKQGNKILKMSRSHITLKCENCGLVGQNARTYGKPPKNVTNGELATATMPTNELPTAAMPQPSSEPSIAAMLTNDPAITIPQLSTTNFIDVPIVPEARSLEDK